MPAQIDLAEATIGLLTSGIGTVIGAIIGYRLAISAHVREKRHDFIVEQLRDFYAPMLALRDEISTTTDGCWNIRQDAFNSDWFYKHAWPLYLKFDRTFSERLWLALPATRSFHRSVMKTIHAFDQMVDNDLINDQDLVSSIKAVDQALEPFHDHLHQTLDTLQRKLLPGE